MAQQSAPSSPSNLSPLVLRIVSAAVMLPIVFGAVWLGGWFFAILLAIASGVMYWEWQGLCGQKGGTAVGYALISGAGPIALIALGDKPALIGWAVATLVVLVLGKETRRAFLTVGFAYISLACIVVVWLRGLDAAGETVIWLGVVVVMTDTCAYFTGRTVGGPKLAPKISPKKTWSGLVGGIVGASLAGAVLVYAISAISGVDANIAMVAFISGGLAIIAQIGDLAVSKAKRAYGVKDSSNIIPGHGGALDRFDGVLSAALAIALLSLAGGGSPLIWL